MGLYFATQRRQKIGWKRSGYEMKDEMKNLSIAIIGAGIGGLTAAAALQRLGFRPRVFERATELGEVGASLTLSPNATHALNSIGFATELEALGMQPDQASVRHWQTGELMITIPRGAEMLKKFGAAYIHIHRADLHGMLQRKVQATDPEAIRLGAEFTALHERESGVEVNFADGSSIQADVVIGADGVRSSVRLGLFGEATKPNFTGFIAFRGLIPVDQIPPDAIKMPSSCLSKGINQSFARYLIRDGRVLNFVGLAQRKGWHEEGWSFPATIEEVLAEFEGWDEDVRTIIKAVPADNLFKWGMFNREPLSEWTRGHVTLLGDAAHPMLPFLGSGAAMAIEDAVVLARAFESAASIDEALRRYFDARYERATDVMLKSTETALAYHSGNDEGYSESGHVTGESLGMWAYNAAEVAV
jgi:salicylate hydroxylase